jgi:16S rRNA (guanine1207-N2)-methyltransferase
VELEAVVRGGVYGAPPLELARSAADAVQLSPLAPGSEPLERLDDASLSALTLAAPAGTLERRYVLAQALRVLTPGGRLTALAPKDKGGARIRADLESFGCVVHETAKRHHRIAVTLRPEAPVGLGVAIEAGGQQRPAALGLWSQPGVFSWDRADPGSALLARAHPALSGDGADLGCGVGYLALTVLASPKVTSLALIDIDRRAIEAARRNVADPRVAFAWADVRSADAAPSGLDFVVMNPPFHDGAAEDRALGQVFIRRAAQMLRKGGVCWLVANRHLPYEAVLAEVFSRATQRTDAGGFKVYEAVK